METLGKSSISTTMDIYSHVLPSLRQAPLMRWDGGLVGTVR